MRKSIENLIAKYPSDLIFSLLVAIILSLFYSFTIAPGLTWQHFSADGGDFIAAAATGGVPHPGGYPFYLILARVFQLIPFGSLAFRTNLLSAVCTIFASLILYTFLKRALHPRSFGQAVAFFSALVYGTLPLIWGQALVTEVYALHGLLIVSCFHLLNVDASPRLSLICGLLFGLSAANHLTSLFLLPLLALGTGEKIFTAPQTLLYRGLGLLAGLSLYALLPLFAMSDPPINWGDPSTLEGFIWLVSGQIYQTYTFSLSILDIVTRLRTVAGIFISQFTLPGVLLVLYGLLSGLPRKIIFITVWTVILFTVFAVAYGSYDSQVYLLPVWLCFVIWLAYGLSDILESVSARPQIRNGAFALLFIGLFARAAFVFPLVDASKDFRAEDFVADSIERIPPDAIVFATGDEQIFSLWYMRFALHQRSDVVIVAEGLLQFEWYNQNLKYTYIHLNLPEKKQFTAFDLTTANPNRTICYVSRESQLECP